MGPVSDRARIEVARGEALGEPLKGWDPKVEVGLLSYGPRRKNDCSDIEVLAPAAKVDPATLTAIAGRALNATQIRSSGPQPAPIAKE